MVTSLSVQLSVSHPCLLFARSAKLAGRRQICQDGRQASCAAVLVSRRVYYLCNIVRALFSSDKGGGKCVCPRLSVCLSVC